MHLNGGALRKQIREMLYMLFTQNINPLLSCKRMGFKLNPLSQPMDISKCL